MSEEIFDVVNERDEVIGQFPRRIVHRDGHKHRAVHVLVFGSDGRVFLQKRSMTKDTFPGAWDSSASGHVDAGEDYDACAVRELREELGLTIPAPPRRLFKMAACEQTGREFVWVYLLESDGPFVLHPEEIERGDWFESGALEDWICRRPQDFASAFLAIWKSLTANSAFLSLSNPRPGHPTAGSGDDERYFVNVSVENLGPCKRLMRVEIEAATVDETFAEMTRTYQREARLPGFRPGKAPKDMVAKRYETEILDEAKRKLISDSYRKAVADQKLNVVGSPDIEEIEFAPGQKCQFAATLEIAPEFELPDYKGLPARRETGGVTPADVEKALRLLGERQTQFNTVARELKEGDVAVVNYTGTCDGKPITDTAPTARGLSEKKDFWINVDKTSFIPGFGEQLIGMKAGEKRTVSVDFPADFVTPQLAGKKGVYEVELVEAKEKAVPEMNEAFAKSYGAESMEKLREGIRADLQNEWNLKQSRSIRNQVVQNLLGKIKCDLPESLLEQETKEIVYSIVHDNQQRGVGKETLDAQKDQIYTTARNSAAERIKASFAFQRVAEKEGVRVEQMEIARRLQDMATQYKMPVDKLVKELEKSGGLSNVYSQLLNEKVVDLLVQYARLEDGTIMPVAPVPA